MLSVSILETKGMLWKRCECIVCYAYKNYRHSTPRHSGYLVSPVPSSQSLSPMSHSSSLGYGNTLLINTYTYMTSPAGDSACGWWDVSLSPWRQRRLQHSMQHQHLVIIFIKCDATSRPPSLPISTQLPWIIIIVITIIIDIVTQWTIIIIMYPCTSLISIESLDSLWSSSSSPSPDADITTPQDPNLLALDVFVSTKYAFIKVKKVLTKRI